MFYKMKRNRVQKSYNEPQSPSKHEKQTISEKAPLTRSKVSAQDSGLRLRTTRAQTRPESSENAVTVVNDNNKHYITPLKTKTKASKGEGDEDVHSIAACSITPKSKLSKSKTWSPTSPNAIPYYLGACSQELPEVCWDYNSPKNSQKRLEKSDPKATIEDLLKNLHDDNQPIEKDRKAPIKILDKWLAYRNNSPTSRKAERCQGKMLKKRYLMKEMKAAFNSFAEEENKKSEENNEGPSTSSTMKETTIAGTGNFPALKRTETLSSFDDDSIGFNSDDDLWGEDSNDDEVIIKATQDFETCLISCNSKLARPLSSIPETCPEVKDEEQTSPSCDIGSTSSTLKLNKDSFNNNTVKNCVAKTESESITNNQAVDHLDDVLFDADWDSNLNDCDWTDDSFVLLETLSRVPEDALSSQVDEPCANGSPGDHELQSSQSLFDQDYQADTNTQTALPINNSHITKIQNDQILDDNADGFSDVDSAIFNDDCFADDASNWLESIDSQSTSPKCSEDEIAHKKQEALKRLREKQKKIHSRN